MALVDVKVPDIGDFDEVAVIELLVKVGDSVRAEQSLITVESDKASMEIPSSTAGVVKELRVALGDKVKQGSVVLVLQATGEAAAPVPATPVPAAAEASTARAEPVQALAGPTATAPGQMDAPVHHPTGTPALGLPHASPSVRKFARELGVPLAEVQGKGPKGRITLDDVQGFTKSVMAGAVQTAAQKAKAPASTGGGGSELGLIPWPKVDFAKFGPIDRKELGRIKKISGANLLRNAVLIPAVTNFEIGRASCRERV